MAALLEEGRWQLVRKEALNVATALKQHSLFGAGGGRQGEHELVRGFGDIRRRARAPLKSEVMLVVRPFLYVLALFLAPSALPHGVGSPATAPERGGGCRLAATAPNLRLAEGGTSVREERSPDAEGRAGLTGGGGTCSSEGGLRGGAAEPRARWEDVWMQALVGMAALHGGAECQPAVCSRAREALRADEEEGHRGSHGDATTAAHSPRGTPGQAGSVCVDYMQLAREYAQGTYEGAGSAGQRDGAKAPHFGTPDYARAAEAYRQAAADGNPLALYNLAVLHIQGLGVVRDTVEAASLLSAAADRNVTAAQYLLATLHFKGAGVAKDQRKAFVLFSEAAASGHADALEALAECYYQGIGVPRNLGMAAHFFDEYDKRRHEMETLPSDVEAIILPAEHGDQAMKPRERRAQEQEQERPRPNSRLRGNTASGSVGSEAPQVLSKESSGVAATCDDNDDFGFSTSSGTEFLSDDTGRPDLGREVEFSSLENTRPE